jgi:hypothetical protein
MIKINVAMLIALLGVIGAPSFCTGQCLYKPASPRLPAGLSLQIRTKQVGEAGRPLILHIQLTNESKTTVKMRTDLLPERDYEMHVRDQKGKEAPFTNWGRQLRTGPIRGPGYDITLAPGEKYEDQEDISKLYEISVPGNYTVEVCRELYVWGNIYSNKTVIPFVSPPIEVK